jgi:hypothetical protein
LSSPSTSAPKPALRWAVFANRAFRDPGGDCAVGFTVTVTLLSCVSSSTSPYVESSGTKATVANFRVSPDNRDATRAQAEPPKCSTISTRSTLAFTPDAGGSLRRSSLSRPQSDLRERPAVGPGRRALRRPLPSEGNAGALRFAVADDRAPGGQSGRRAFSRSCSSPMRPTFAPSSTPARLRRSRPSA